MDEQTPEEIIRKIIDKQIPQEIIEKRYKELILIHTAKVLKEAGYTELSELCLAKHRELYEGEKPIVN